MKIMTGKDKCRSLRAIRKRIAEENGVDMIFQECNHPGDCAGTCPLCDSETRQLEGRLQQLARMGKKIALAGLCAGMIAAMAGCAMLNQSAQTAGAMPEPTEEVLSGDVAVTELLMGEVPAEAG